MILALIGNFICSMFVAYAEPPVIKLEDAAIIQPEGTAEQLYPMTDEVESSPIYEWMTREGGPDNIELVDGGDSIITSQCLSKPIGTKHGARAMYLGDPQRDSSQRRSFIYAQMSALAYCENNHGFGFCRIVSCW